MRDDLDATSGEYYAVLSALRRRHIFPPRCRVPTATESRGRSGVAVQAHKTTRKHGRDDAAADGLVAAAAAASEKKLAPVAQ